MGSQQLFAGLLLVGTIVFIWLGLADRLPGVWAAAFGSPAAPVKATTTGATTDTKAGSTPGLPGAAKYVASMGKSGVMLTSTGG